MNKKGIVKITSTVLLTGILALGTMGYLSVNAENNTFKIG